ncbi:MAG: cation:proton antiporter [Betaproteobacteria bacterium]|nr:cation:proton antiporter [Betaproteobacteria bacterium]
MHGSDFVHDLAIVMLVAGFVTLLFHRFKQPVVLGYILAGVFIGPHTPPFEMINDKDTIDTMASLGVILLLFALGLEFNLKKLASVGWTAFFAVLAEIMVMMTLGYSIAMYFGWGSMNGIFLGAMLSVTSSTIIIKVINDLKLKHERFAQLVFGIVIFDDMLAIGMMVLLTSIALTVEVGAAGVGAAAAVGAAGEAGAAGVGVLAVLAILGKLMLFLTVAMVLGIIIVPRLLNYVARYKSDEMMLVTVLGLCFGFCLIVLKLEYSVALGAFVIGAIMAESRQIPTIARLIEPVRNMFSAIFFVSIGLLFEPALLFEYAWPVVLIVLAVVFGKFFAAGSVVLIAGYGGRTAMRVGMGLSQIGEFSFIIAMLGQSLGVTDAFLYPIAVAVAAVTSLVTPYLIKLADPLSRKATESMPARVVYIGQLYSDWLQSIQPQGDRALQVAIIRRIVLQVIVNLAFVTGAFMTARYYAPDIIASLADWGVSEDGGRLTIWVLLVLLSLPFLLAAYGKLKALSMVLAEFGVSPTFAGRYAEPVRRVIAEVIPLVAIIGFLFLIVIMSLGILPTVGQLGLMFAIVFFLGWLLRDRFRKIHARLQAALFETLSDNADAEGEHKKP